MKHKTSAIVLQTVVVMCILGCESPRIPKPQVQRPTLKSLGISSGMLDHPTEADVNTLISGLAVDNHEDGERVEKSLAKIGDSSVDLVINTMCTSPDPLMKHRASRALRHFGQAAIPRLVAAAKTKGCRNQIIQALGDQQKTTQEAIAFLIESLYDQELTRSALSALENLARHDECRAAVPAIVRFIDHADKDIRYNSRRAVWEIDIEAAFRAGLSKGSQGEFVLRPVP